MFPQGWKIAAAGLIIALAIFLISFAYLLKLARDNFGPMFELLPISDTLKQKAASGPLISHVSDIHITRSDNVARVEGGRGGQHSVAQSLTSIKGLDPA